MESSGRRQIRSKGNQPRNPAGSGEIPQCSTKAPSKGCLSAWRQLEAQAVQFYQTGNYSAAAEHYSQCLQQTGIPSQQKLSLLFSRSAAHLKLVSTFSILCILLLCWVCLFVNYATFNDKYLMQVWFVFQKLYPVVLEDCNESKYIFCNYYFKVIHIHRMWHQN